MFPSGQISIPELQLYSVLGTNAPKIQDVAEDVLGVLSEGERSRQQNTKEKEGLRDVLTGLILA